MLFMFIKQFVPIETNKTITDITIANKIHSKYVVALSGTMLLTIYDSTTITKSDKIFFQKYFIVLFKMFVLR